jgi:hypothetical protein
MIEMGIELLAAGVRATPNPGEFAGAGQPLQLGIRVALGGEVSAQPDTCHGPNVITIGDRGVALTRFLWITATVLAVDSGPTPGSLG